MNGRLSCLFIQDGAAFIQDERGTVLISCVPGTRNNLAVKVRYRHGSRNC